MLLILIGQEMYSLVAPISPLVLCKGSYIKTVLFFNPEDRCVFGVVESITALSSKYDKEFSYEEVFETEQDEDLLIIIINPKHCNTNDKLPTDIFTIVLDIVVMISAYLLLDKYTVIHTSTFSFI